MADDDKNLKEALEALARHEGKSSSELLSEMMRERIGRKPGEAPLARREPLGRSEAIRRHDDKDFPQTPVVQYDGDPYGETPEEAKERWLAEEAELLDGVHGFGGQSAGGIFGDGTIATSIYDPGAESRATARAAGLGSVRLARVLERLESHLDERAALPEARRKQLPRRR